MHKVFTLLFQILNNSNPSGRPHLSNLYFKKMIIFSFSVFHKLKFIKVLDKEGSIFISLWIDFRFYLSPDLLFHGKLEAEMPPLVRVRQYVDVCLSPPAASCTHVCWTLELGYRDGIEFSVSFILINEKIGAQFSYWKN